MRSSLYRFNSLNHSFFIEIAIFSIFSSELRFATVIVIQIEDEFIGSIRSLALYHPSIHHIFIILLECFGGAQILGITFDWNASKRMSARSLTTHNLFNFINNNNNQIITTQCVQFISIDDNAV